MCFLGKWHTTLHRCAERKWNRNVETVNTSQIIVKANIGEILIYVCAELCRNTILQYKIQNTILFQLSKHFETKIKYFISK